MTNEMPSEFLSQILVPSTKDLGGFQVRRVLPAMQRKMVGPFIFFDHIGPAQFEAGQGIDVRPHPHIGLATVTYLFGGSLLHRDSLGCEQLIEPGAVNLMTAGKGIAHSERTAETVRAHPSELYGIQTWLALPRAKEEVDPRFEHTASEALPRVDLGKAQARIIAGKFFGAESPVRSESDWFYADIEASAGSSVPLEADYAERGVYLLEGEIEVDGVSYQPNRMLIFKPGSELVIKAIKTSRLVIFGGEPVDGERFIYWNFVSSRRDRIEQAKEDWTQGKFAPVVGDSGFIPLP